MLKEKIKRKLSSRQGTSIFFGLLLFLAASILSVVIINGAVTTVKRVASDRKTEQNYLSCSSAAKLLREKIEQTTITQTTVVRSAEGGTETTVTWTTGTENANSETTPFEEILKKHIQTLAETPEASTSQSVSFKWKLSVKQAATSGKSDVEDVFAKCTISKGQNSDSSSGDSQDAEYDISILLTTGDGNDSCQMVLSLNGSVAKVGPVNGTEGDGTNTSTTTTTYTWTAKDIIYGNQERTVEGK